jgi:hypothetical protein
MLLASKETTAMRIGQSFGPAAVGARRNVERSSGSAGFAERIGGRPVGAAAAGLAPLTSLAGILAVQEVDEPLTGRRRARQRGDQLLDALDELKLALLDGKLPPGKLRALQSLASAQRGRADDPALQAVLDEIELRTAVELAKLDRDLVPKRATVAGSGDEVPRTGVRSASAQGGAYRSSE